MSKLQDTIKDIEKTFGEGAIIKMGDKPEENLNIVSTGSIGLDKAIGVGGLVKGRIVEIYGENSSGKSTLAQHIIAEVQKGGGRAALIDAEYVFDRDYATALGVNVDELYINQPASTEEGLGVCDKLVTSGEFSIIVIDSVAALVPQRELDGEVGDSIMGKQASLMSQALRKITGNVSKTNTLVIFINQTREKIGLVFGNPTTTTSGKALAFYASVRLDISKIGQIKEGDNIVGNRVKVKVVKNKLAAPFKSTEFTIRFGVGIDQIAEIIEIGSALGIIKKSGSWYSYGDTKIGQGENKVKELFKDNPELEQEIREKIKEKI